jgi:uncharacterized protein YjdB
LITLIIKHGVNFLWQSKKQEQDKSKGKAMANQEQWQIKAMAYQEQGKSKTRANQEQEQYKANQEQGQSNGKRGDILPVIMLFFKSSHQFLCRSQYIRTNVSITLFFFFIKFKSF